MISTRSRPSGMSILLRTMTLGRSDRHVALDLGEVAPTSSAMVPDHYRDRRSRKAAASTCTITAQRSMRRANQAKASAWEAPGIGREHQRPCDACRQQATPRFRCRQRTIGFGRANSVKAAISEPHPPTETTTEITEGPAVAPSPFETSQQRAFHALIEATPLPPIHRLPRAASRSTAPALVLLMTWKMLKRAPGNFGTPPSCLRRETGET